MLNGIYRATVINGGDPSQLGRVQVSVPAVGGVTGLWAATALPPGNSTGYATGQSVWVVFEGGQADSPVVIGVRN